MLIRKKCLSCDVAQVISVDTEGYDAWREGALIQNAFPYLTADEREMLMSGICGKCFDKMFMSE